MSRQSRTVSESRENKILTDYIGETNSKGDNGFYTKKFILNTPVEFLIDNGSSASLLSFHKYDKFKTILDQFLRNINATVHDASSNIIRSDGAADVENRFRELRIWANFNPLLYSARWRNWAGLSLTICRKYQL